MFHSAKLAKTASQALARAAFMSGVLPSYTRVSFCSHLRRSQQRALSAAEAETSEKACHAGHSRFEEEKEKENRRGDVSVSLAL